jgi:tetratricopeptide (TPR) repeat protein
MIATIRGTATAQGVDVGEASLEDWAAGRLGATLTAVTGDLTGGQAILPQQLVLAFGLAEIATEVSPQSVAAWRRLFDLATVLRSELPEAEDAARRAARRLVELDPDDIVMRLRVLLDRVNDRSTAEDRIEAFETLLSPGNVERLGDVQAARLAFDLGVLQLRVGDLESAARRIVEAVDLDPSFPQAADMLAGLFRSTSASAVEEAELLAIAFHASPLEGVYARRLGQLALSEGAYATAADVLELALILTSGEAPFLDDLVADRALALWGAGRSEEAIELLGQAHRSREILIRRQMLGTGIDPDAVMQLAIPPAPSLALVETAIVGPTLTTDERVVLIDRLFNAFRFEMSRVAQLAKLATDDQRLTDEARSARLEQIRLRRLELTVDQAWARAWFGWSPPIVDGEPTGASLADLLDRAASGGVLTDAQRLVIDGWWAIHQDDFDTARSLLAPASGGSPYAAAGLALLNELQGETKDAARDYLQTYRRAPGELVGLWSRSRLERLLSVPVPAPERASEVARIVADTLPEAVGRALRDPRHGVLSIQIDPVSLRSPAFEPVLVDVTITNVSGLDLAIGGDGPIQPTFAVVTDDFEIPVDDDLLSASLDSFRPPTLVLPLDRRLRLNSQESIRIRVDLTATRLARLLDLQSYLSGTLRLRAVVNFAAAPGGAIDSGLFGREGRSPVFRVDGRLPLDASRAASMLESIRDPRTPDAAKNIAAIIGITLASPNAFPASPGDAQAAAIDAFMNLPPRVQAWVMTVTPGGDAAPTRLVDRLITDDEVGLPLALARFSPTPTSAAIVRGLESTDPRIRRMAEAARELAIRIETAAQREFALPQDDRLDAP